MLTDVQHVMHVLFSKGIRDMKYQEAGSRVPIYPVVMALSTVSIPCQCSTFVIIEEPTLTHLSKVYDLHWLHSWVEIPMGLDKRIMTFIYYSIIWSSFTALKNSVLYLFNFPFLFLEITMRSFPIFIVLPFELSCSWNHIISSLNWLPPPSNICI